MKQLFDDCPFHSNQKEGPLRLHRDFHRVLPHQHQGSAMPFITNGARVTLHTTMTLLAA